MNIRNGRQSAGRPGVPTRDNPSGPIGPTRRKSTSRIWWVLGAILLVILIIPSLLADMLTDWMWFNSQNLADVYTTRLWLAVGVFFGAGLLATIFLWANWAIAWRAARPDIIYPGQREPVSKGIGRIISLVTAIILGIILGLAVAEEWPTILLYIHSVPFGQTDPLFNNDIGLYVFALPFYQLVRGWAMGLLVLTAIGVGIIYMVTSGFAQVSQQASNVQRGQRTSFSFNLDKRVGAHLSVLGAVFLLLLAAGYWLGRFNLLYSSRAVAYGAGYTDVNAKLPAQYILMAVTILAAVLLVANIWVRTWKLLAGTVGAWLLALIVVGGLYPAFVQQFIVKPSEPEKEQPYILNNIAATRKAFGLDKFREREVPAVASISQQELTDNKSVVNDIRLWDYRPLLATFSQLQEIRSYYSFSGVDIDRYTIDGQNRQVMLSARELATGELDPQVRTWQNQHLIYTHGYGAVVASVNDIVGEGLPRLLLQNIPPKTDIPVLSLTRPELYYGELTDDYAFVNSRTKEFDYPLGDNNQLVTYAGKGGVALSNIATKLLFSVRFGDGNIMLSDSITPETRVLFHRNIHDSVKLLAPFLQYDNDPYLVIADGKLYWIQDAYTTSDRYPYSTPYEDSFNYIRNSVKVVISAYDGSTTFYVADPTDPIVESYRGIFPALFKDMAAMPASIKSHIRYPEDIMNVQARMFATYHMTDPRVFYQKEDLWTVPSGAQNANSEPLEAYYTIMSLPGEKAQSFQLILPFTPSTKDNMIAWMAASSDGENYGQVDVIRYPKQQLVYGPRQIEARINQDPTISSQLTLWNQQGSTARTGNLLTVPISNSVLYVEPLFLQATTSKFPELKRVIVATGDHVGFGVDLASALEVAMGSAPKPPVSGGTTGTSPTPGPAGTPLPGATQGTRTAADITRSALGHYDRAQDALRRTDWAVYGQEITAMKADLDELATLTGGAIPPTLLPSTPESTPEP